MFKSFAAATATVALALGLSLVAIAPANADEAPPATDTVTTDTSSTPPTDDSSTPPTDDSSTPPTDDSSTPPTDDSSTPPTDDSSSGPQTFSALNNNPDTDTPTHSHNPVTLCHATPADTAAGGWISITVDDNSAQFPNQPNLKGHDEHAADIIPAFWYWYENESTKPSTWEHLYYPGFNLDTVFFGQTGAEILAAGCNVGLTSSAVMTPQTCTENALVAGFITVTLSDYLEYSIDGGATFDGNGKTGPLVTGQTYTVTVSVVNKYKDNFTVTPTSFKLTIAGYQGTCGGHVGGEVTPLATPTGESCSIDPESAQKVPGFITLSNVNAITYTITRDSDSSTYGYDSNGKSVALPSGAYTVHPVAKSGFTLSSSADLHVTVTSFDGKCQLPSDALATPLAQKDPGCSAKGSYTLSNSLSDPAAIIWTVNGSTVAEGTYKVDAPATVIVHAAANSPTYGLNGGVQTDWTLTFLSPAACGDLKTLALTGTDDGLPMLAASGLLLLLGVALVRSGLRIRRQPVES